MDITFSNRMSPLTGSAIREIFKMLADPTIISLAGGNPSPLMFPKEQIAGLSEELLRTQGERILQYGATEGWPALRELIQQRHYQRGIQCKLDECLVLTGSSQGIELATKVLLNSGDVILVENPTFLGALQTFNSYGAVPIGVNMDSEGILLDEFEDKIRRYRPKMVYLIPSFQNPSGQTMSLARRRAVLELASTYDFIILEDDPYGELRYEGEAVPTIKSMDTENRVLLLNSFSKTVSPGLRVGSVVGDSRIIRKMVIGKQGMDTCTCLLSQAIIHSFIQNGFYDSHLAHIISYYRSQRDVMMECLAKEFPKCAEIIESEGGLFIWIRLPEELSASALFPKAIERKVAFVPGEHFYADGSVKNALRLNFSMPNEEQIRKGCQILGDLLKEELG